ncbi:amidohydrolase family protein [Roseovarius sp. 2305UL8-3]|uniref:amidohydrolase family protein n=1 Tax=Roseovarius conchicola TaxID=3121636 RepID=UPI003527855F
MINSLPSNDKTTAVFGSYVLDGRSEIPTVIRDHWVILEGDRVAAISDTRPIGADVVLDAPGRFVLPGLMNLHNHCFSEAIARSHVEDGGGVKADKSIVYTVLLPLSKSGLDILSSQERLAIARMGIVQLLLGGATSVMEPFRNGIPEMFVAALELGIRFWGAPYLFSASDPRAEDGEVVYNVQSSDGSDNTADLKAWNALYETWQGRDNGRIGLAMSPHATDTCDPDLLRASVERARHLGVPITTHLAQSASEVEKIKARWGGRTPAEYLDWLGVLGPDLLAAHCVFCSDNDLALLRKRDVTVMSCPRVFVRIARTAAFGRFEKAGLRTMVGTDGYNMDLLGELNAAAIISKTTSADPEIASASKLLQSVTSAGGKAVGRPDIGRLKPGAKADLTVVDMTHPHLQPHMDPVRTLISLANRAQIDSVIVDGRLLVSGGEICLGDQSRIVAEGCAAIEKIWDLPEARAALSKA